ncbi:MAG: discoidin domain-containing protein, partial [Bacteroidales bacterium]|nr:discoidin domain-containing protein [Bacteroidales bacterium]
MPCSTQAASGDIYRNIALHRAATNSSSYDYNLTAQLLTDGIIPEEPACYIEITRDGKPMSRIERGYLTDLNSFGVELNAGSTLEVVFHGYSPAADKIQLASRNMPATRTTVKAEALGPDGKWTVIGTAEAAVVPVPIGYKGMTMYCWEFPTDASRRDYRFRFEGKSAVTLNEVLFFKDGKVADILPSKNFVSAWKSLGTESEWASIDLGGEVRFDKMRFHWINGPESGKVQVSEDGKEWKEIASFDGAREEISFPETRGRHVRLCLKNGNGGQPFELGEWEVYGHAPVRTVKDDEWILCRASETS